MRLIPLCLPLVLAPLLVTGQQAQTTSQKPAQPSTAKQATSSAPHKAATRHRKRHHSRKTVSKRTGKRAENSKMPVDVINGGEVHRVLLDKAKSDEKRTKASQRQMKVDVINGSATDTQYFSDQNQEAARNQAVVVGVQSSDTRFAGGNQNAVVTGIASSSTVDARASSSGGAGVARQVSPRPKRPAYQPDEH